MQERVIIIVITKVGRGITLKRATKKNNKLTDTKNEAKK
jgi:hypothetical protein